MKNGKGKNKEKKEGSEEKKVVAREINDRATPRSTVESVQRAFLVHSAASIRYFV